MVVEMLRRRLFGQNEETSQRYRGGALEVRLGGIIDATLKRRGGVVVEEWTNLNSIKIWDVSITTIESTQKIVFQAVLPRVLVVEDDSETDELKVFEIEPGAVIPP